MSSILDALNKLEQEKTARSIAPQEDTAPATPEEAAAELLGDFGSPKRVASSFVPWKPVVAFLVVAAVLVSLTAMTTLWLTALSNHQTAAALPANTVAAPEPDASIPTTPIPKPTPAKEAPEPKEAPAVQTEPPLIHTYTVPVKAVSVQEEAPPAKVEPIKKITVTETAAPPKAPPPPPAIVEPVFVPEPVQPASPTTKPMESVPAIKVAASPLPELPPPPPAPLNEPAVQPVAAPVLVAQSPQKPIPEVRAASMLAAPPARSGPDRVDMNSLPRLSVQERETLGLDGLRLNVLRPADKDQPDALAIINLKKVYVGEMIPGTQARLIGVESSAIAVEIESNGAPRRYRIPR